MRLSAFTTFTVLVSLVAASPLSVDSDGELARLVTPGNPWAKDVQDGQMSTRSADTSNIIDDHYIVVLKAGMHHHLPYHLKTIKGLASSNALDYVKHHFAIGSELAGFAGKFSASTLEWIRRQPGVDFVERDSIVKAMDIERGAPWGLARISHRPALRLGTLGRYEYAHDGGRGVDVYVIDTGVNINHVELEGRAKWGKTMPLNDVDADGNGHGSHVAGTIASAKYGVAKEANIIAVKVLGSGGSGSMSDVVGGVAWAASQAASKAKSASSSHKGSVANMSLGGGKSAALDLAVNNAVKKGLHFAVAAGNDNRDACSYSPAGAENAITVGASTIADARAYFSNWGKCVDIFAPGLNILSIWNTGNQSVNTISGTSMASPHIAGLTAYYLSLYPEGGFKPSEADYVAAGVGYMEEEATKSRNLFQTGKQLVFGKIFGSSGEGSFKPLDPKVLKQAMLRLSTKDLLTQLPNDTPNYLAFNNYTLAARFEEVDSEKVEAQEEEEIFSIQPIFDKAENVVEQFEEYVEKVLEEELQWLASA